MDSWKNSMGKSCPSYDYDFSTKAELIDQPRLTDMEYRVIAINKAGQSPPSNTVTVVL